MSENGLQPPCRLQRSLAARHAQAGRKAIVDVTTRCGLWGLRLERKVRNHWLQMQHTVWSVGIPIPQTSKETQKQRNKQILKHFVQMTIHSSYLIFSYCAMLQNPISAEPTAQRTRLMPRRAVSWGQESPGSGQWVRNEPWWHCWLRPINQPLRPRTNIKGFFQIWYQTSGGSIKTRKGICLFGSCITIHNVDSLQGLRQISDSWTGFSCDNFWTTNRQTEK